MHGAINYEVQVATIIPLPPSRSTPRPRITYYVLPDADALDYGIYYWRARAQDAAGNWSDWSAVRTLVVTFLHKPDNAQHLTDPMPLLRWYKVADGATYSSRWIPSAVISAHPCSNMPACCTRLHRTRRWLRASTTGADGQRGARGGAPGRPSGRSPSHRPRPPPRGWSARPTIRNSTRPHLLSSGMTSRTGCATNSDRQQQHLHQPGAG